MTIIAATDFSQAAAEALAVAVDIARKRGEKLLLWHCVQPPVVDPRVDSSIEPMLGDCATRLELEAKHIRDGGVIVDTEAVVGWPDRELPARMPSDTTLIVAGARGHARGTHWLVGSVVERLADVTPVPLLVVHDATMLRKWLSGASKLNVIVATDFSAVSDFALRRTSLLQELGPCNLELLYVEYPPTEHARLGITGPIGVHHPLPFVHDVLSRELTRRAESVNPGGVVSTRVATTLGATGALIALEADQAHADLVIVGAHQRKPASRVWHGSIAHGVLHSAETNVLLIPFHTADEDVRALEAPTVTTILAATDFSSCGNHAVAWARAMARPGTHVVITTVVKHESEAEDASRELDRIKSAVTHANGGRIDTVVAVGKDIAATICTTAESLSADAIIVGRHTRSRISQLFIGSVSGEVLARSHRPVLVVPDPATM